MIDPLHVGCAPADEFWELVTHFDDHTLRVLDLASTSQRETNQRRDEVGTMLLRVCPEGR